MGGFLGHQVLVERGRVLQLPGQTLHDLPVPLLELILEQQRVEQRQRRPSRSQLHAEARHRLTLELLQWSDLLLVQLLLLLTEHQTVNGEPVQKGRGL